MRYVVGYDQALAVQCFRRNLGQIVQIKTLAGGITPLEVDYLSERLAETSVYSIDPKFGSPWVNESNLDELAEISPKRKLDRLLIQRCEQLANHLIIFDGIVNRRNARAISGDQIESLRRRKEVISRLYGLGSRGAFRTSTEKEALQSMAKHVHEWIRCLTMLPGHDYMDLLSHRASVTLHLPS